MKFGKSILEQSVPGWELYYLNYKQLKGNIKRVQAAQRLERGEDILQLSKGTPFDPPISSVLEEKDFFTRSLMTQIDKINDFYLSKETELVHTYSDNFEMLLRHLLSRPENISLTLDECKEFFEFAQQVDNLRKYTVLNYIGVLKICKKFDKKTSFELKPRVSRLLIRQPFYTSTILAALFTEVQCQCAQLIYHSQHILPQVSDYSCPICNQLLQDPIVLSCTHRFCRSCLSDFCTKTSTSHQRCPTCEKEFDSLDPATYRVDNILEKFIDSFIRRNETSGLTTDQSASVSWRAEPFDRGSSPIPKTEFDPMSRGMERQITMDNFISALPRQSPSSSDPMWRDVYTSYAQLVRVFRALPLVYKLICFLILMSLLLFALGQRRQAHGINYGHFLPTYDNAVFVGHTSNDVDSICSAIAAAKLYNGLPARADDINRETQWVLSYFNLPEPPLSSDPKFRKSNWCLVDHNQKDKVPNGVNKNKIVCVLDHHQLLGNAIELDEPRVVDIQPIGSTASMIAVKYLQSQMEMPKEIAGCLLSGILSDTVNLRSPTTTDTDSTLVHVLAPIAGVDDLDNFYSQMAQAKSNLAGMTMKEIIFSDYKSFTINNVEFGWGSFETVDPSLLHGKVSQIQRAMADIKVTTGLDLLFFSIVDVVKMRSDVVVSGEREEELVRDALNGIEISPGFFDIGSKVSRKKDFIPPLARAFQNTK
eukprot:NODE_111_length_2275_cov_88.543296_g88_i0.p1 GENE.NODE_111_length_2275_cov_88.543296_g88_i0~~NODE_111_length_2275_cov_88.543296_g88_i0.p1  ORF type:complete len:706 (+),score=76.96 NODE_111_length_2275_cov_88.543296_g88_i0:90-2207(+)